MKVMVALSVLCFSPPHPPHYPYTFGVGSKVGGPSCLEVNGCSVTCMELLLVNSYGETSVLSHHVKVLAASISEKTLVRKVVKNFI